jgi:hypothetical protein
VAWWLAGLEGVTSDSADMLNLLNGVAEHRLNGKNLLRLTRGDLEKMKVLTLANIWKVLDSIEQLKGAQSDARISLASANELKSHVLRFRDALGGLYGCK